MTQWSRRRVLSAIGCGAAISVGGPANALSRKKPFFAGKSMAVGLQLYTLGNDVGKDIDASFARVAQIGYRDIELPGLYGKEPAELAAAASRAGVKIRAVHLPLLRSAGPSGLTMASDPQKIADTLGALGAKWAVAPIILMPNGLKPEKGESFNSAISRTIAASGAPIWHETARHLNERAAALKPHGIQVALHNHNVEFAPIALLDGHTTRGWDILWQETQPDLVHFEVDLGWVATAGLDPVKFLKKARGRVRLLHLRDAPTSNPQSFTIDMKCTEIGSGTLDWGRILPEAYRSGARHFFVEQEPPFADSAWTSITQSHSFLSQIRA